MRCVFTAHFYWSKIINKSIFGQGMNMKAYAIFYKGKRPWTEPRNKISDFVIRLFTHGKYSHCEIAVPTETPAFYECFTSSLRDRGVRSKPMILKEDHWDKIEIDVDLQKLREFLQETDDCKYDFFGCIGVLTSKIKHSRRRYFCSEWCAKFLNIENPEKISPSKLYDILASKK